MISLSCFACKSRLHRVVKRPSIVIAATFIRRHLCPGHRCLQDEREFAQQNFRNQICKSSKQLVVPYLRLVDNGCGTFFKLRMQFESTRGLGLLRPRSVASSTVGAHCPVQLCPLTRRVSLAGRQ